MEAIRTVIEAVVEEQRPCSVRGVYYQCTTRGVIEKTEAQYDTTGRLLVEMRRSGRIDYGAIADNTRVMRKPRSWASLEDALERTTETYRRALWDDQDAYVEIWCEKDAISGVLYEITSQWDVPLMVTRGFASLSFLHAAAEAISYQDKPAYLYYFGDHDPSGVAIPQKVEQELRRLAPNSEIHFERVAVLPWQIEQWKLPTRPTKRSDSRSRSFVGESVEVDAIPANVLRDICHNSIVRHIDPDMYDRTLLAEKAERATLAQMIERGLS